MGAKSKKRSKRKFIESQKRKSNMRGKNRINLNHDNETEKQLNEENNFVNESGPSTSEQRLVESPLTVLDLNDHSLRTSRKKSYGPRSLAILCKRVVKKYKLIAPPEPKKFTPPETFSVVGGKSLRKRSEGSFPRQTRNTYSPRSLAVLCQIVIEEYNLLPQSEESLLPASGSLLVSKNTTEKKRSRGRPRKPVQKDEPKIKRSRGRPRKDSNLGKIQQPTVLEEEPISYPYVRVKEESSMSYVDPLQDGADDEDYTVEIKFEAEDNEVDEFTHEDTVFHRPQSIATSQSTITYPSPMQVPGPSTVDLLPRTPQFITVVMDEYQIFANRIAEQLRVFPPERALLLQRGIQAMIDNERELIEEEN